MLECRFVACLLLFAVVAGLPAQAIALPPELVGYDPSGQIRFSTLAEAEQRRTQLINFIWDQGLPSDLPVVEWGVSESIFNSDLSDVNGNLVSRVDRLTSEIANYDYHQVSYLMHPKAIAAADPPRLAIVSAGHVGKMPDGLGGVVDALLDAGQTVLAVQMPTISWNDDQDNDAVINGQTYTFPRNSHDQMFAQMEPLIGGSMFRFFLEPIVEGINQFKADNPTNDGVMMTGLSGGGWASHLMAAVDTRIDTSIPVAGSYPLYARPFTSRGRPGDAEQNYAPLYQEIDTDGDAIPDTAAGVASWLEIYALGGIGEGRSQTQVLNLYDPCCFDTDAFETYDDFVSQTVQDLGSGNWDFVSDDTHTDHKVSPPVLESVILASLPPIPALALKVNPATGQTWIVNTTGQGFEVNGYGLISPTDGLNPAGWNSLEDDGQPGWQESAGANNRHLSELNLNGALTVGPGDQLDLGSAYAPAAEFGATPDPISFEYNLTSGVPRRGTVEFLPNTLVLQVDPATGEAQIVNPTGFTVELKGYAVVSESGSLDAAAWTSFSNDGQSGWDESANATKKSVSETNLDGSRQIVMLEGNGPIALGHLFDHDAVGVEQDLIFEFVLAAGSPAAGDYNDDGVVNLADYTVWRDHLGAPAGTLPNDADGGVIGAGQYHTWKANFGMTGSNGPGGVFTGLVQYVSLPGSLGATSVSEPASGVLAACALLGLLAQRPRSSQTSP